MKWIKHRFTKCTVISGTDVPDARLGELHLHAWSWSDTLREAVFVPPCDIGRPFLVTEETMKEAMKMEKWEDAVSIFHTERARAMREDGLLD
jgi:hypothetical protein